MSVSGTKIAARGTEAAKLVLTNRLADRIQSIRTAKSMGIEIYDRSVGITQILGERGQDLGTGVWRE